MDLMKFRRAQGARMDFREKGGKTRVARLAPAMVVPFEQGEGGLVSQTVEIMLDPIPGRLLTPIWAEIQHVFVPVEAAHALKFPGDKFAGVKEIIRDKLVSGTVVFGLEAENDISRRFGVTPRSISGAPMVSEFIGLAHNAAVNHLRRMKYWRATTILAAPRAVTNALYSKTALQLLGGVLDPEDRVDGAVALTLPSVKLPVRADGTLTVNTAYQIETHNTGTAKDIEVYNASATSIAANKLYAQLSNVAAGNLNLRDFYQAENMDRLVREMDQILEANPEYGFEMVLRWAHGLEVDVGKTPLFMGKRRVQIQLGEVMASDTNGVNNEIVRTDGGLRATIELVVPKTELGGLLLTFISVLPDETLGDQPDPFLSVEWKGNSFVADSQKLDPVAVTARDLQADLTAPQEAQVLMWTGYNALKRNYRSTGFNRATDLGTVVAKNAMWQAKIPLSVSPDNIVYPDNFPQNIFADANAEVVTFTVLSTAAVQTPTIFGPKPVENISQIDTENLFDE